MKNNPQNFISTNDVVFNYFKSKGAMEEIIEAHTHNYYEIILFLDGNYSYIVKDKSYKLQKFDLIITKPNTVHQLQKLSETNYERYNIVFNPSLLGDMDLIDISKNCDVINVKHNEIILNIFNKLDYYCSNLNIDDFISMSYCLIKELLFNVKILKQNSTSNWNNVSELLKKAISIIDNNLFEISTIADISNKLYISETYLYKLFKEELNTTPKKYMNEKKLIAAKNMILLGKKPSLVALSCGFNEYSSFYRNYLKFFGYPPSENNTNK